MLKGLPGRSGLGKLVRRVCHRIWGGPATDAFSGSSNYWECRYAYGGNSGCGSFGRLAEFKAEVLNSFVSESRIESVIEFGCGDGNQLRLAEYPRYIGVDVSPTAIAACRRLFSEDASKTFIETHEYAGQTAHLSISLDVIYHLVEDEIFEEYMRMLFDASDRYVIVYSSDLDPEPEWGGGHVRHRNFTRWIREHLPEWQLGLRIPNRYPYCGDNRTGSLAEFFIYETAEARQAAT